MLIVCMLAWRSRAMIDVTGPTAAESARKGISAAMTMVATAG